MEEFPEFQECSSDGNCPGQLRYEQSTVKALARGLILTGEIQIFELALGLKIKIKGIHMQKQFSKQRYGNREILQKEKGEDKRLRGRGYPIFSCVL